MVSRRSFERIMPPCSAIARNRLDTRQSVDHDRIQTTYASGRSNAIARPIMTRCTAMIWSASGRRRRIAANRTRKFLYALTPVASRRSLRRHESAGIGYPA